MSKKSRILIVFILFNFLFFSNIYQNYMSLDEKVFSSIYSLNFDHLYDSLQEINESKPDQLILKVRANIYSPNFSLAKELLNKYPYKDYYYFNELGQLDLRDCNINLSKRNFEKSIELKNDQAEAYFGLGLVYYLYGDLNQSYIYLNESIKYINQDRFLSYYITKEEILSLHNLLEIELNITTEDYKIPFHHVHRGYNLFDICLN